VAALTVTYSFAFEAALNPAGTAHADAASLDGGGVAVVTDLTDRIRATFYSADGAVTGAGAFPGNTGGSVSQLSDGNVVIGGSFNDSGSGEASFTIVSATGDTIVAPTAADGAFGLVVGIDVAGLSGGGFVMAMQASTGGNNDVRVVIRGNDGGLVTSFAVDATAADDQAPSVAALADGGFAVAWHRTVDTANQMWYAVYEANGTVRKEPALLDEVGSNQNASVVALQDGGFAIAYEDTGWSDTGDTDITLARFDAAGVLAGMDDLSQNDHNDTAPSTTLLSNGMIVVGSSNAEAGFDPRWTLASQETGDRLGFGTTGFTAVSDLQTSVAGMLDGQVAAFFTTGPIDPDIVGQVLQVQRHTSGDTVAADNIAGDELVDIVTGGGGNDTIRGGGNADSLTGNAGNDRFVYGAGEMAGDTINGNGGFDSIVLLASANLATAEIFTVEAIAFDSPGSEAVTATIDASQVGAGLPSSLVVGSFSDGPDTLRVLMGPATSVDLSGFVFDGFDTFTGADRMLVLGDDDAEVIIGSEQRDMISSGGGNDTLSGSGGGDTLRGGLGDDVYLVNSAGEAVEAADQGIDTVRTRMTTTLDANLENLVLLGTEVVDGTGNGLKNTLTGNSGANALDGGNGNDTLAGGAGADALTGGDGRDRFDFNATGDSAAGLSDVIADFVGNGALAGDTIDLSTIDANVLVAGNQDFVFIGAAAFTAAGQVRYAGGLLVASTDGDLQAELRIELAGSPPLVEADLVL
jgi:hypothetical protein